MTSRPCIRRSERRSSTSNQVTAATKLRPIGNPYASANAADPAENATAARAITHWPRGLKILSTVTEGIIVPKPRVPAIATVLIADRGRNRISSLMYGTNASVCFPLPNRPDNGCA